MTDATNSTDGSDADERGRFGAIRRGARGGLFATVVMTVYRAPVARSPPPPTHFWKQYVGVGGKRTRVLGGLALHLLYGTVAGALYGGLVPSDARDESAREAAELLAGVVYALALSVFGTRVVLGGLLDLDLEEDEAFIFHVGHAVYGLSLGTWHAARATDGGEDGG